MAVVVVDNAVDMPWITMPILPRPSAESMMLDAPSNAIDSDTMVPNTPVRIRMLLMNLGRLILVLSVASRVDARRSPD